MGYSGNLDKLRNSAEGEAALEQTAGADRHETSPGMANGSNPASSAAAVGDSSGIFSGALLRRATEQAVVQPGLPAALQAAPLANANWLDRLLSRVGFSDVQWVRVLGIVRVLLAASCIVLCLWDESSAAKNFVLLWAIYGIYGMLGLIGKGLDQAGYPRLGLLVDMVFFLLCAWMPLEYSSLITSLFYLFVLLTAALLHTTSEIVVVIGLALTFFFLTKPTDIVVVSPAMLLTGSAVVIMALQRKALQERLSAAAKQSSLYRMEAEMAREAERQRIAADFHDGPLQSFVGMQMRLEVVRKMLEREPKRAMEELMQLQELTKMQAAELRTFVRSMRPVEVDGEGMVPSIRKLVENFYKESGIASTFVGGNARIAPDSQTSVEILKIVREALHNVQKHSKASRVTVGVSKLENQFELSVEDDGTGFPFSGAYTLEELELLRLGPVSIRRRVRILGGEMMLDSQPGKGASMKIRIPL